MKPLFDWENILLAQADKAGDELIALTSQLVQLPSENIPPYGAENEVQLFIQRWLEKLDLNPRLVYLDQMDQLREHELYFAGTGDEKRIYSDRPNLAVRMRGAKPGRSLILSGHADVVPAADHASWKHSPFGGIVEHNRIYGRGSLDMKGGLATSLIALKILAQHRENFAGELIFESVVDEEHGGANGTLANRLAGYMADAVILTEPSGLKLYNAHKGFRIIHLSLCGRSGMNFMGEELPNPVEQIGLLIDGMKAFRAHRAATVHIPAEYAHDADPVPVFMNKLQAGQFSLAVPMQIPQNCKLEVYWQTMPGETRQHVEEQFHTFLRNWIAEYPALQNFTLKQTYSHRWMPATLVDADSDIVQHCSAALAQVTDDQQTAKPCGAPFPCDLFIFNQLGIPGVILGPGGAGCHGPDEYVEIDSLVKLLKTLLLSSVRFCANK